IGENMTYNQVASASASSAGHLLTSYTWTPLVGIASVTDPSGRTTTYSYDSAGRLTGVTDPGGSLCAAYAYNTVTDHIGYNSSNSYHGASLLLPQNRNWVLSQTFNSDGTAANKVSYYNGLGYPEQDIAVKASGEENMDLVVPHAIDYLLREEKAFLPFPVQVSGSHGAGAFVSNAENALNSFYCNRYSVSGNACAYSESGMEEVPYGRLLWTRKPGRDYYNASAMSEYEYDGNSSSDAVYRLNVNDSTHDVYVNGTYAAGTLLKASVTDEDGRIRISFSDREGRVVLERRLSDSGSILADTYYAYDRFGRLSWVISPEGSVLLQSGYTYAQNPSASDTASQTMKKYSCIYIYSSYDEIEKKEMAGTRTIELTYGTKYLPETVTDGNLAAEYSELVYGYDGLNRIFEERLNDIPIREYVYDSYPSGMPATLAFSNVCGVSSSNYTMGLLTYENVAELDENGDTGRYAQRAHYYDVRGNRIQTVTLFPDGTLLRESWCYDLNGSLVASAASRTSGVITKSVYSSYTNDNHGRITSSSTSIGGVNASYVEYSYDDLGLLDGKVFGNTLTEGYLYNIRGQATLLEAIVNDSDLLYSQTLRYANAFNSSTTPSWTGNISSWSWEQSGQQERTYVFGYDGLGRLASTAQYNCNALENKYGEDMTYDRNGNVTSLGCRNGSTTTSTTSISYD
ncbi:MAG: RHS repeat protein, partial [Bacteroidales bacterium]|nr:RHS repeat protein [Bacteroidales bacterium]